MMSDLTLLYAEDDLQSRKNYAFVLEEYFSTVYLAKNGREALDLYHEKSPDVLLLDVSMPLVDGLEVAKSVRETNKEIPIIMLTAHGEQERLLTAIPLGLSEYLLKPINNKKLINVILKTIIKIEDKDVIQLKKNLFWNKIKSNLSYERKSIKLTKKEKILMEILVSSIGEHFMHDTLILQVWNSEIPDASHDNKLHQLVYRLNRKIKEIINNDIPLIKNSYTLGYQIDRRT